MKLSDELEKAALAKEPFPPTDTTLDEPGLRATLDDRRLADREVGSSLKDQEIAGQAILAIAEDGRVNLGDGLDARITVKSEGGIATLSGVVDCAGERIVAEELVEAIPGVELVQSAITVSVDGYLDDEDLARQVRASLDNTGLASVGSRVSHGVARLVGTVQRLAEEERAIKVAAGVKGIRDVVSNLKVRMPEYTDDIDLLSLVAQQLGLNDLVVLDREIDVHNGTVHVAGKVQSLLARRRALRAIADIAGVRAIKDNLQVDHVLFRNWQARTHLSTGR